jgi:hypothetical protein
MKNIHYYLSLLYTAIERRAEDGDHVAARTRPSRIWNPGPWYY